MYNFISHIYDYVPKDHNFGGGFCIMKFSLSMLFEQWEYWQNFWTASNKNYDLCRYTGAEFKFWRDPIFDYIVAYDINPPLTVAPLVYQSSHPERMLLRKHRVIVRSKLHAPRSRPYKRLKIRPPRTLCTKWFFQKDFSEQPLLLLTISTADLDRQWMAHTEVNPQVGITTINTTMFGTPKFGFTGQGYELFKYLSPGPWQLGKTETNSIPPASKLWSSTEGLFARKYLMKGTSGYNPVMDPDYKLDDGQKPKWEQIKDQKYRYTTWPVRYNPFFDKGKGNIITSVILGAASWEPTCEKCTVRELPLWLGFFGYIDWMMKAVVPTGYLVTYTIAFKSPYTQPPNIWIVPIDYTFYSGTNPFNIQITDHDKTNWYPVAKFQQATINGIVTSGPFMPRIDSTKIGWDFHANYKFFLSGEDHCYQDKTLKIQTQKKPTPSPVMSLVEYKYKTRGPRGKLPYSIPGTSDGDSLVKELLKESVKTQSLENIYLQALSACQAQKDKKHKQSRNIWTPQATLQPESYKKQRKLHQKKKKRRRRHSSSSSETSESSKTSSDSSS